MQKIFGVLIGAVIIAIIVLLFFTRNSRDTINYPSGIYNGNIPDMSTLIQGQTEAAIQQNINSFSYRNTLNVDDENRYRKVLENNLTHFKKQGTGNNKDFKACIIATVEELRDLMIYRITAENLSYFFRVANLEFDRHHRINFAEKVIEEWVAENVDVTDRLNMVRDEVNFRLGNKTDSKPENEIYLHVKDVLLFDIGKVTVNPALNEAEYNTLVNSALQTLDEMPLITDDGHNYTLVTLIPKIYYDMGKVIGIDVSSPLLQWYAVKTKYTPLGFDELELSARQYLQYSAEARIITQQGKKDIEKILEKDLQLFRFSTDSVLLTHTAIESLEKIEIISGDTEDREFFAALYCDMAYNQGFSIGKEVDKWMYGSFDKELEEEMENKMPWER